VTFDAADPAALGEFWAATLGYVMEPPPSGFDSWDAALEAWGVPADERDRAYAIVDPDGHGPRIFIQKVPEGKTAKNRVHLDVRVATGLPVEEMGPAIAAAVRAAEALGGEHVEDRVEFGKPFTVMRDPEGNEFCLT
jgi:hypothetical protein